MRKIEQAHKSSFFSLLVLQLLFCYVSLYPTENWIPELAIANTKILQ